MKYEPYVMGIARNLYIPLPPWIRHDVIKDNWQAGPWDRMIQAQALGRVSRESRREAIWPKTASNRRRSLMIV